MRSAFSFLSLLIAVPLHAADAVDFNRDVRPILADACFHCHGPDKANRKGNLRLDVEAEAKKAIVAGKPAESELVRRITSHDAAERMPPANSGRSLTPAQIATLTKWVEEGAKWQKHWAFVAPVRPALPAVKDEKWVKNPIDRFVLARLEKEGLKPSPEASPYTLIRRVSFDLTGLPPTPEEVDAFVKEYAAKPDVAYEKLVDRLLASPRYGERMAWRWLEAARYADTNGYQTDAERFMWRWRDWVIDAYNSNLSFDRFTIEQIAGDMLPKATLDQKIATGFNRNHRGNSEGGIIPEEYACEYVVDRVETTATVWLGLTLGCTRCHDHKYDPFTQKEFYQLFAYFNNVPEKGRAVKFGNSPPFIKAPTREQQARLAELEERLSAAEDRALKLNVPSDEVVRDWAKTVDVKTISEWLPDRGLVYDLKPEKVKAVGGTLREGKGRRGRSIVLDGQAYGDLGSTGDFGFNDKFTFSFWIKPAKPDGVILSRTGEEPRSEGYSIRLVDGRLQVHMTKRWLDDALRVEARTQLKMGEWVNVIVQYDGSREASGVVVAVDGELAIMRTLLDELNQDFRTKEPFRIGAGGGPRFEGEIESLRIYDRLLHGDEASLYCRESVVEILRIDDDKRTWGQKRKLESYFYEQAAPEPMRAAWRNLRERRREFNEFTDSFPTVMVMEEMKKPRDTYLLLRGEYDKKSEKVSPGVPAELPPLPQNAPNNRLGFARWLVDTANPLTARVAVNRMWQLHFGTGLVKTVEDFGTQGEYPTHPELLDWLATEFVRVNWDMKRMHKAIVMSATYRQSSSQFRISDPKSEIRNPKSDDPDNRLLSRGPRSRLSAEMVRDQALLASGLLVEKVGGPSVRPYQPAGLWKELSGADDYKQHSGENLYRRSLYSFWKRSVAPPTLATFDAATRETCVVRESRTNTPLQALTLLNDVTYVEAARMMAQRVMKEANGDARIERAFRLVLSRPPSVAELEVLKKGYERQLTEYRADRKAAERLLKMGEAKADASLDVAELAALSAVCSLILNLDEAVTKE